MKSNKVKTLRVIIAISFPPVLYYHKPLPPYLVC